MKRISYATYGASCLLAFLSPTTCHLSNLRSINLILSLYPLSCSLSSFFLCWGFVYATMAFPQHNPLKKKKNVHSLSILKLPFYSAELLHSRASPQSKFCIRVIHLLVDFLTRQSNCSCLANEFAKS